MTASTPETPPDASSGAAPSGGPRLDREKVKTMARAGRSAAKMAWASTKLFWKVVKPKKWDLQHVLISAAIIVVVLIGLYIVWGWVKDMLMLLVALGLAAGAVYLFFSAKPPGR